MCCLMGLGDRIVVVVQKQRNFGPESSTSTGIANKVRRGDIRHAVVVRAAKEMQRPDGSVVKFDDNACVLVNKTGDPIGTRMNGQLLPRPYGFRCLSGTIFLTLL